MRKTLLGTALALVAIVWLGSANGQDMRVTNKILTEQTVTSDEAPDGPNRPDKVELTDAEWRAKLDAEEYRILREAGTERAFTGKYWDQKVAGTYLCGACGLELFSSTTKYESGSGWPSFHSPIGTDHVYSRTDKALGVERTEVVCNRCGGHLGHIFDDGPQPSGLRYCINGNALDFKPEG